MTRRMKTRAYVRIVARKSSSTSSISTAGSPCFLESIFDAGGPEKLPIRTDKLGLTYSQRTNSQKLRYWGLAEQYVTETTGAKRGWWKITDKGIAFLLGQIRIPKYAFTKRNVVTRFENPQISFRDVSGGYLYRQDYADQARAQLKIESNGQLAFA